MTPPDPITNLLQTGLAVLNVGVSAFTEALETTSAPYVQVDWRPPAQGDPELGALVSALADDATPGSVGARIAAANAEAVRRILAADPVWEDVRLAREIWPEMDDKVLFHAGPPIESERMCGPMQGAVI